MILNGHDLLSIAESAVEKALINGADDAEAFIYTAQSIRIIIEGPIIQITQKNPIGIGIRAVKGKKVGFASASSIEDSVIENTAKSAIELANLTLEDKDFTKLASPIKRESKNGIIDDELSQLSSEELLKMVVDLKDEIIRYDPRIKAVEGGIEKSYELFAVTNSQGIDDWGENAKITGWIYGIAKTETESKSGFDYIVSRRMPDFSKIAESAAKRAIESLGAKKLKEKVRIPVIIENRPLSLLINHILAFGLSGRNAMLKSSYYSDKENAKVADSKLTIIDDGQLPEGINTTKIDHEGIPKMKNVLIEKGVLKSFIYDTYSAYKLGEEPTGNASRVSRSGTEPFNNTIDVNFNNIIIPDGTRDFKSFIESFDKAIVVKTMILGVGHSNRETGDFSIVAPNAFLWENGKLTPLESVTLAGNFYKILENIIDIAGDAILLPVGKIPSIAFENITVA